VEIQEIQMELVEELNSQTLLSTVRKKK